MLLFYIRNSYYNHNNLNLYYNNSNNYYIEVRINLNNPEIYS